MSTDQFTDDMNALLDLCLDDLEDLPEFKPFPPGTHDCIANFERKAINGDAYVELKLKLIETVELADPNTPAEQQCKPGDESNTLYNLGNEFGRGALKAIGTPVCQSLGLASIRELIESKDVEVRVTTGVRKNKDDPDKKYLQVKELSVK
jgi:hypothetical protein